MTQATVLDEASLPSNAQDAPAVTFSLSEPELLETPDDLPIKQDGRVDQADSNTVPEVRETLTTSQRSELVHLTTDFKL